MNAQEGRKQQAEEFARIRRAAQRGLATLGCADYEKLPDDAKAEYLAATTMFDTIIKLTDSTTLDQIAAIAAKTDGAIGD